MPNSILWLLDEHNNPVPVDSVKEWRESIGDGNYLLAIATVQSHLITTVFLGIDTTNLWSPTLFQTLVTSMDGEIMYAEQRYKTYKDAMAGHAEMLENIKLEVAHAEPRL